MLCTLVLEQRGWCDMTQDMLIEMMDNFIAQWVDEEMELNGDTVSREQRLQETRTSFLADVYLSWGEK
jgi:hypothetical protein